LRLAATTAIRITNIFQAFLLSAHNHHLTQNCQGTEKHVAAKWTRYQLFLEILVVLKCYMTSSTQM